MTSIHGEGGEVVDVTIEAVRDRFHTLDVPLAYFDGPAGTQCPDSVIEAISGYLLAANANSGGKFLTSMVTDDVIAAARAAASDLLGVHDRRGRIRPEHDDSQLRALTHGRPRLEGGRRDRRDEARPRREHRTVAAARRRQRPEGQLRRARRRVPARSRPYAVAAVGAHQRRRVPVGIERGRHRRSGEGGRRARPFRRRARLVRRGALRAARRHRDPRHGRRRPALLAVQVLRPAHGPRLGASRPARGLAPVQGTPLERRSGPRHETGTLQHELLCGFIATVEYLHGVGWTFIGEHERKLGQRFLDGLPEAGRSTGHRRWTGASRPSR